MIARHTGDAVEKHPEEFRRWAILPTSMGFAKATWSCLKRDSFHSRVEEREEITRIAL